MFLGLSEVWLKTVNHDIGFGVVLFFKREGKDCKISYDTKDKLEIQTWSIHLIPRKDESRALRWIHQLCYSGVKTGEAAVKTIDSVSWVAELKKLEQVRRSCKILWLRLDRVKMPGIYRNHIEKQKRLVMVSDAKLMKLNSSVAACSFVLPAFKMESETIEYAFGERAWAFWYLLCWWCSHFVEGKERRLPQALLGS